MSLGKKFLSVLTATGCMLNLAVMGSPSIVNAETSSEVAYYEDCLEYVKIDEDDDGTFDYVEITDCDKSVSEIEIPAEIEGLPVTSIGNGAFSSCESLESVTIPDSVTSIGDGAFIRCDTLESITLPDSITNIGGYMFYTCFSLTSITIPKSVTSIEESAFFSCTSLESIIIENSECRIYDDEYTIPDTAAIYGYQHSTAQEYAEKYDRNFESLGDAPVVTTTAVTTAVTTTSTTVSTTAPYSPTVTTTAIEPLAYEKIDENNDGTYDYIEITGCKNTFAEIMIPEEIEGLPVKTIAANAFNGCDALESITIPSSVTEIGSLAFFMCSNLKNINVDDENTVFCDVDGVLFCYATDRIGELILWQYPTGRTEGEYILPENTAVIGNDAFSMSALESIVLNEGLIGIRCAAFTECANLKSLTIPENVIFAEQIFNCSGYLPDEITIENPDLDISAIFDMTMTSFNGTIKGYDGSMAESFAEANDYDFESLGEALVVTTTAVTTTSATTQTTASTTQTQVTTVQTQVTTTALVFGTPSMMGDSDNDGSVGLADIAVVIKYVASTSLYYIDDPVAAANADVNHDWVVNAADVQMLIEYMLNNISELPF